MAFKGRESVGSKILIDNKTIEQANSFNYIGNLISYEKEVSIDNKFSKYSRTPLIRTLVNRIDKYPDRFGPSGKFYENSTKLTCPEITSYRIKYSTVLWLIELQIRRGRKI